MLLRFRFSNYRSFRDEQELTLIRNRQVAGRAGVQIGDGKEFSLPVCAIYGSNASGKSNLLKALQFVQGAVLNSHRLWKPGSGVPLQPFRPGGANAEAEFALDFLVGEVRYQFGFCASPDAVTREWLYSYPAGKRKTAYVREQDDVQFGRTLQGDNKTIAALMRPNSLFLSAAAQNNHRALLPVYGWFLRAILFFDHSDSPRATQTLCADRQLREHVVSLLAFADLGIVDLALEDKPGPLSTMAKELGLALPTEFPPIETVTMMHQIGDSRIAFDSGDESAGTKAYFALLGPVIGVLEAGATLVVDEIDSSLHPNLTAFLVRLFASERSNPRGAQLVFTTHDTTLLDNGTPDESSLTRDEIWLVQKDQTGASSIYPLSDFKPVKGENISRSYLAGRFGSVPFINSERIIEQLRGHAEER